MRPARVLARLLEELRARPRDADPAELHDLALHVEGDRATLRRGTSPRPALTLGDALARGTRVREVTVARGLYASLPGTRARVALLAMASALASERIVVPVRLDPAPPRLARAVVDAPRALAEGIARRLGRESPLPAPGDRFDDARYVHVFADETTFLDEVEAARLAIVGRDGATFVLEPSPTRPSSSSRREAPPRLAFAREVARTVALLARAEEARLGPSPERAVTSMRARGEQAVRREPRARARLRRAIAWVDAIHPRGPNCYRRTLLELALDGGAAREPLVFGLDVGGTGHVAFKGREELGFDALFEIPPAAPAHDAP